MALPPAVVAHQAHAGIQDIALLLRGHLVAVSRDGKLMTADDVIRLLERAEAAEIALRSLLYARGADEDASCEDD